MRETDRHIITLYVYRLPQVSTDRATTRQLDYPFLLVRLKDLSYGFIYGLQDQRYLRLWLGCNLFDVLQCLSAEEVHLDGTGSKAGFWVAGTLASARR